MTVINFMEESFKREYSIRMVVIFVVVVIVVVVVVVVVIVVLVMVFNFCSISIMNVDVLKSLQVFICLIA